MSRQPATIQNFNGPGPTNFYVDTTTGRVYYAESNRNSEEITDSATKKQVYSAAGLDENGRPKPNTPQSTSNNSGSTTPPGIEIDDRIKLKDPLSYPKDLSKNQTYIEFISYDYSTISRTTTDVFSVANDTIVKKFVGEAGKIQAFSSDIIKLYVPPGINVRYGADWGTGSLGAIGASYLRGDDPLSKLGNAFTSGVQSGVQKFAEDIASAMTAIPGFGATGEQLIGLTTGLVFNRNEFSTFTRVPMRNFNYSFVFVARNKEEKTTINQIVNCFKLGMLPFSKSNIQNTAFGESGFEINQARPAVLKYPKLWLIKYKKDGKDNIYLPISKFCALTNFSINYTPNSVFTTLTDGAIPAIQIDLSFQELTPLTGDEVLEPKTLLQTQKDSENPLPGGLTSPEFFDGKAISQDYKQQGATF